MEKKVLYINACARSESRTGRIARALLERLGGLQEEVKLAEMDLQPLSEERLSRRTGLIEDCRVMQDALTDCTGIDRETKELLQELEIVMELIQRCVDENSRVAQDQEEYLARYNGLVDRYEKVQTRIKELEKKRTERMAKADAIGGFMFRLRELDQPLEHFNERLWLEVIDHVTVHQDGKLMFKFQNGTEVRV